MTKDEAQDLAVVGAYMANGFLDAGSSNSGERQRTLLDRVDSSGHIGLICELCAYAPYARELRDLAYSIAGDYPGVWEYEVVEPFGAWYGDRLLEGGIFTTDEARTWLRDATLAFFKPSLDINSLFEALVKERQK